MASSSSRRAWPSALRSVTLKSRSSAMSRSHSAIDARSDSTSGRPASASLSDVAWVPSLSSLACSSSRWAETWVATRVAIVISGSAIRLRNLLSSTPAAPTGRPAFQSAWPSGVNTSP